MQVFTSLNDIRIEEKTSVALGNFDGIHIGHIEILKKALDVAKEEGLKSLCYTFSNHPFNFIMRRDENEPEALKLICSEEEKISMLEDMGFDYLVNLPFDEITMKMSSDVFFNDVVIGKLNARAVSVGFNYTYGARAMGNANTLIAECQSNGIICNVHDAVRLDGKVVSSTLIREEIANGNMEIVAAMLGRPYRYMGLVVHGKSIGGKNGIPTLNLDIPRNRAIPPCGVYAGNANIDEQTYKCIINIGYQPTFGHNELKLEAHLFGYEGSAYGSNVIIMLDRYIRPERKFDSKEELYAQIEKDCETIL